MGILAICPGLGREPKSVSTCVSRDLIVSIVGISLLAAGGLGLCAALIPSVSAVMGTSLLFTTAITTIVAGGYLMLQGFVSCCKLKGTTLCAKLLNLAKKIGFVVGIVFVLAGTAALTAHFVPQMSVFVFPSKIIAASLTALAGLMFFGFECHCVLRTNHIGVPHDKKTKQPKKELDFIELLSTARVKVGQAKRKEIERRIGSYLHLEGIEKNKEDAFWQNILGTSAEEKFLNDSARSRIDNLTYDETLYFLIKKIEYLISKEARRLVEENREDVMPLLGFYLICCIAIIEKDSNAYFAQNFRASMSSFITPTAPMDTIAFYSQPIINEVLSLIDINAFINT